MNNERSSWVERYLEDRRLVINHLKEVSDKYDKLAEKTERLMIGQAVQTAKMGLMSAGIAIVVAAVSSLVTGFIIKVLPAIIKLLQSTK